MCVRVRLLTLTAIVALDLNDGGWAHYSPRNRTQSIRHQIAVHEGTLLDAHHDTSPLFAIASRQL